MHSKIDLEEILNQLNKKYIKPKDLSDDQQLLDEKCTPHIMTTPTGLELIALDSKSIHPVLSKYNRPDIKSVEWTENVKPIGFSASGKFLAVDDTKSGDLWFIKGKKMTVRGPYTASEMEAMIKTGELVGSMIKRTSDTIFVSFEKIKKECPLGFSDPNLSSVFVMKQEELPVYKKSTEGSTVVERCLKSAQFLKSRNSKLNILGVQKMINGLTKNEALRKLNQTSGMLPEENVKFLSGFLGECGIDICTDVDSDGFQAVEKSRK